MLLLLHVMAATSSVLFTTYLFLEPSRAKLRISYGLLAFTLGSGTYLVVSTKANMVHACLMGLIYTAIVSFGITTARSKLAAKEAES